MLSGTALPNDAATLLLLRFDGVLYGAAFERPTASTGTSFETGLVGQAIHTASPGNVNYATTGNILAARGTVEFWIKPDWNGNTNTSFNFFEVGDNFNNGMLLAIDGANNLRCIQWGDDPTTPTVERSVERDIGADGSNWVAGSWHHIAATWDGATHQLAFYVDGQSVGTRNDGVQISSFSSTHLAIGAETNGAQPARAAFDEFRISNLVRTAEEILEDAQAATRPTPPSVPEIAVALNDGTQVLDGQAAAINLGDQTLDAVAPTTTFVIRNEGRQTLELRPPLLPWGFVLVQAPQPSVAAGRSTVMIVALRTSRAGNFSGEISIGTNDADENPFNFPVRGSVSVSVTPAAPEIAVAVNGSNLSATTADVRVGTAYRGQLGQVATLTLRNEGTATLQVDNFRVPVGFRLLSSGPYLIRPQQSRVLYIALDTVTTGIKTGTLQFQTNDSDEGFFSINLRGKVYAAVEYARGYTSPTRNGIFEVYAQPGDHISIDYPEGLSGFSERYTISTTHSSGLTSINPVDGTLTTVRIYVAANVSFENWTDRNVILV